jgi:hypothetical protein
MVPDSATMRRWRVRTLAVLAGWLVIQNALVIALLPWGKLSGAMAAIGPLTKALVLVAMTYWTIPAAAVLALGIVALWWGDRAATHATRSEARHG